MLEELLDHLRTCVGTPGRLLTVKSAIYCLQLMHEENDRYKFMARELVLLKAIGLFDKLLYVALNKDDDTEYLFDARDINLDEYKKLFHLVAIAKAICSREAFEKEATADFEDTQQCISKIIEKDPDERPLLAITKNHTALRKSIASGNYKILDFAWITKIKGEDVEKSRDE